VFDQHRIGRTRQLAPQPAQFANPGDPQRHVQHQERDDAEHEDGHREYSQASGCATEPGLFQAYLQLLFAHQPPENSAGLTDERLIELGHQAGAGPDFATCVRDARYPSWTAHLTDAASAAGIHGTPTILVAGQRIANTDAALRHAVAVAQG
jgi:protein-disulfide isomerase